jgi:hypothetical protein
MTDAEILDQLLEKAANLPAPELPRFLGGLEQARYTALARLSSPKPAKVAADDQLLNISEASAMLGCSRAYLYRHPPELSGCIRRIGKKLLYSRIALQRYIDMK